MVKEIKKLNELKSELDKLKLFKEAIEHKMNGTLEIDRIRKPYIGISKNIYIVCAHIRYDNEYLEIPLYVQHSILVETIKWIEEIELRIKAKLK
jgi:hypothetical protein